MSIPDSISLDILPSANGTFASTSKTITVQTTFAAGYTLGFAASTANSNALINTSDSSKTIPSISASTFPSGITEANYSNDSYASTNSLNNTYAYKPSYYHSASNSNYLAIPTSTSVDTLHKRTSISSGTTYSSSIYLGARVDTTLAPGTYENTFVFSVVANPTPYTISYNANTTDTNNAVTDYDEDKFIDYKLSQMENVNDTITYTIEFTLTKTDKGWQMDALNDVDIEKLHGIFNQG